MPRSHAARRPSRRVTREEDLIARTEAAVALLSKHFAGWMQDECRRLAGLCRRVEHDPSNLHALAQLLRAADDIKSEASAFSFPAVERIAASLCGLITAPSDRTHIPLALIAQHVAAVPRALDSEGSNDSLADELERATAQYLDDARSAGEYPKIQGPPLAPGQ
jgi:hypothetical protein